MHADATEITCRRSLSAMRLLRTALGAALVSVALVAAPAGASPPVERSVGEVTRVVAISVDGLNPDAIGQLGVAGTPTFHRLMAQGASTLNARTEVEMTVTLPNHTGMVTSRRVDGASAGTASPGTTTGWCRTPCRRPPGIPSARCSRSSRASAGAARCSRPRRSSRSSSGPGPQRSIAASSTRTTPALVKAARGDLATRSRAFTFLHISLPDVAGHAHGWFSPAYLAAVKRSDYLIGRVLATIGKTAESREHTLVIVTADHGGLGPGHENPRLLADYRVPFFVWGPGVPAGADLYDLNPTYADPGTRRVGYAAPGSRSATATSATWPSTCSGCPPSRRACSTPTRTSRSSPSPRSVEEGAGPLVERAR